MNGGRRIEVEPRCRGGVCCRCPVKPSTTWYDRCQQQVPRQLGDCSHLHNRVSVKQLTVCQGCANNLTRVVNGQTQYGAHSGRIRQVGVCKVRVNQQTKRAIHDNICHRHRSMGLCGSNGRSYSRHGGNATNGGAGRDQRTQLLR
jgi:hypothetical protein